MDDVAEAMAEELTRARTIMSQRGLADDARRAIDQRLCRQCSLKLLRARGRDGWRRWFERLLERYHRGA